jgi:N-acetylglutamate synthase/N-acetylornithine aminotransferase
MAESEVPVVIDLGAGRAAASVLTCDLTEGYIQENAAYLS